MGNCDDIKPKWLSVVRRLQEFSSHAKGRSKFVTITIAVDGDNNPIFWYEPIMKKIEPKIGKKQLLELLSNVHEENDTNNIV